jgi:hypothetical protein
VGDACRSPPPTRRHPCDFRFDAIDRVEHLLAERGTTARRLRTPRVSFRHDGADPEDFAADLKKIERPPQIPYVSNVTGT